MSQIRQVKDIQYRLLPGTSRKTTDIVIERDGSVCVRPPEYMAPEQVDQTVYSKRMWIYRNLAEWRDLNASRVVREWVSGESMLYLGRHYRLELCSGMLDSLSLKNGRFYISRDLAEHGGGKGAEKAFIEFYKRKGQQRIAERLAYFSPKVGVNGDVFSIGEIGYKWASCKKDGQLHFHWKCMMAPPKILDYIIVHELCHNHVRTHSDAYWNEVDKVLPDYRVRKQWLREHGASMTLVECD
ncbi:MAG: SprT family zinc-dependent metalloprotease [Pseudomonadota bacterium]|nr:SprT family zinc-dependent metalloprotease [Pseudomonadota bacterium]